MPKQKCTKIEYKPLPIIKFPERKDQRLNFLESLNPKTFNSEEIELVNQIFLLLRVKSPKSKEPSLSFFFFF